MLTPPPPPPQPSQDNCQTISNVFEKLINLEVYPSVFIIYLNFFLECNIKDI
jgi:hypothetical protein